LLDVERRLLTDPEALVDFLDYKRERAPGEMDPHFIDLGLPPELRQKLKSLQHSRWPKRSLVRSLAAGGSAIAAGVALYIALAPANDPPLSDEQTAARDAATSPSNRLPLYDSGHDSLSGVAVL
jgi:hypothetical protein